MDKLSILASITVHNSFSEFVLTPEQVLHHMSQLHGEPVTPDVIVPGTIVPKCYSKTFKTMDNVIYISEVAHADQLKKVSLKLVE